MPEPVRMRAIDAVPLMEWLDVKEAAVQAGLPEIIRAATLFAERTAAGGRLLWFGENRLKILSQALSAEEPICNCLPFDLQSLKVNDCVNDCVIVYGSSPGLNDMLTLSLLSIPSIAFGIENSLCRFNPGVHITHAPEAVTAFTHLLSKLYAERKAEYSREH